VTFNEANCVVDRLNSVFADKSTDIPSAKLIYDAIEVFNNAITELKQKPKDIPSGIEINQATINRETAALVKEIQECANLAVLIFSEKEVLNSKLKRLPPEIQKKFKL
jgi:hypothetical protein